MKKISIVVGCCVLILLVYSYFRAPVEIIEVDPAKSIITTDAHSITFPKYTAEIMPLAQLERYAQLEKATVTTYYGEGSFSLTFKADIQRDVLRDFHTQLKQNVNEVLTIGIDQGIHRIAYRQEYDEFCIYVEGDHYDYLSLLNIYNHLYAISANYAVEFGQYDKNFRTKVAIIDKDTEKVLKVIYVKAVSEDVGDQLSP